MKFLPRSLTARLLAVFLFLSILPMIVIGFLAYDSGRQSIVSNVEVHLESVVILKEQEIDNWIHHLEHTVTWLASSLQVTDNAVTLAAHPPGDPETMAAHDTLVTEFRRTVALGHFSSLFLIDSASGQITASSDASREGQFRETEPWFIEGKTGVHVSDIFHSLALGRPTMVVAAPVMDAEGRLLGVLAGHANLAGLSEIMLERSGLGETGETYLVNRGNLLLTGLRFDSEVAFKKWMFTEGVNRALAGESGVGLYLDYREAPVIGAYHWIENRDMALLAEIDQAEAFAPVISLRRTVLGIGVGVALMVALLGNFFARSLTEPVKQLAKGAQEIGRGHLDYRIDVQTGDEIGDLANAFNEMVASLRRSLGETAHSQRLLLAVSEAAQDVQRARSVQDIYRAVGEEMTDLGNHSVIFRLTDDLHHLTISHHTFESTALRAAEKIAGTSARDYRIPITPDGIYDRVLSRRETLYLAEMTEPLAESMPKATRRLTGRILSLLGLKQAIYAPLLRGDEPAGVLLVTGADLAETDAPAVTAFANQIGIALENARLIERVRRHAQELERRVEERTQELKQAQMAALNMMEDAEQARQRAEEANRALRDSEERYRTLAETSPDMIFVIDREDRVQYVNSRGARQFGLTPEAVIGACRTELFPPAIAERQEKSLRQVWDSGEGFSSEDRIRFPGRQGWLSTWLVPMRDETGEVRAVMGVSRDITERKQAEKRLEKYARELELSNTELEQFAYVASHDLQEPLRAISGYLQFLQRRYGGQIDEKADTYIARSVAATGRMKRMINDLLAFSRVNTRGKPFGPVPLSRVLEEAVANIQTAIEESNATITVDPLPEVMGDNSQLLQLYQNLLSNAIKFRAKRPLEIHVGAERETEDGRWRFWVRDNGIGIESQYDERIFVIFQRLHTRDEYPGTGIGLAICKKIVERHGGRIWVESEPGEGSTFYFTLAERGEKTV